MELTRKNIRETGTQNKQSGMEKGLQKGKDFVLYVKQYLRKYITFTVHVPGTFALGSD